MPANTISRRIWWVVPIVIILIPFLWYFRATIKHESRVIHRLSQSGVAKSTEGVELVFSSGLLRESDHVFRVPIELIDVDALNLLRKTEKWDSANIERVKPFFEKAGLHDIDWSRATCFQNEGDGILMLVTTVVVSGGDEAYVLMEVF